MAQNNGYILNYLRNVLCRQKMRAADESIQHLLGLQGFHQKNEKVRLPKNCDF